MEFTPKDRERLQRALGRAEGVLNAAKELSHYARTILAGAVDEIAKVINLGNPMENGSEQELLEKYKKAMTEAIDQGDVEVGHGNCDDVLCELVRELGFEDVVEIYNTQNKWYA